jgi:hypothetical protein
MSPCKNEEEKEMTIVHCAPSSLASIFLTYLSEMSRGKLPGYYRKYSRHGVS